MKNYKLWEAVPSKTTYKILYIVPEKYPFYRADLTELFSNGVANLGCHVTWLLQSEKYLGKIISKQYQNEHFIIYPSANNAVVRKVQSLRMYVAIFPNLWKEQYDFIQVRDKHLGAMIVLIAAKIHRIPFIYWISFPYAETYLQKAKEFVHTPRLKRLLFYFRGILSRFARDKILLRFSDFVFVQSDRMKYDMQQSGIPGEKMMPVPMGVTPDIFLQSSDVHVDLTALDGRKTVAYLGTLARIRQPEFMLKVIASVRNQYDDAILLLIGDAAQDDMDFLQDEVKKRGLLDSVVFTGFVPMQQAWAYVQRADVCLSPFRPSAILDSTTPTKLVEYLALGKPVVANTHPDQSKVIGESGGGFSVPYDADAFAKAVCHLLDDPQLAKSMGEKGKVYVQLHRSYDMLASILDKKYLELNNRLSVS